MPTQREIDRDAFLANVKPVNRTIADREWQAYIDALPVNQEGTIADMRQNTLLNRGGGAQGQIDQGKALLRSAYGYFPVLDAPVNPRHIGVNNGIVAYAGGAPGTTPTTNDPLFLPFDGKQKYLYCANNNIVVYTAHKAAYSTPALDVRIKVRKPTWNNGGRNDVLISKTGGPLCWSCVFFGTILYFYHSIDGSSWVSPLTADATNFPVNQWIWFRFTGTGTAKNIQTSPDGVSWTTIATNASWSTPLANTVPLGVGGDQLSQSFNGDVAFASFRGVVDGPVLASFDANLSGQTGYTDAQSNVWTIARAATGRKTVLVEKSCYLLGADDLFRADLRTYDFFPSKPFSVVYAYRRWNNATGGESYFLLLNQAVTLGQINLWRYNADQSENFQIADGGANNANSGVIGVAHGTRATIVGVRTPGSPMWAYLNNGTAYSAADVPLTSATNPQWLTLGASHYSNFVDHEFFGAAIFNSALSVQAIAQVTAALNA